MTRRSQEEWKTLIERQKESSQSATQFCQEHNINEHYFSCVKSKLKKKPVASQLFQSIGSLVPSQSITLQIGDMHINLPPSVDAAWLATLIKHLA